MIQLDTSPYVKAKGKEPHGKCGPLVLRVTAEGRPRHTISTDAPWSRAQKMAREVARDMGKRDVLITVHAIGEA